MRSDMTEKMKGNRKMRRYLWILLLIVFVATQCTQSKGSVQATAKTMCSNHTEHDDTCGYVEDVSECSHSCEVCEAPFPIEEGSEEKETELEEELEVEPEEEIQEDFEEPEAEPEEEMQEESEESEVESEEIQEQPELEESAFACGHIHDEICGYAEGDETSCNHSCAECNPSGELSLEALKHTE